MEDLDNSSDFGGYDNALFLGTKEAQKKWHELEKRLSATKKGNGWSSNEIEILVDDVWRPVCRTDLCDDVCTSHAVVKTEEKWLRHWDLVAKKCMGVRLGPMRWAFIDSSSDG